MTLRHIAEELGWGNERTNSVIANARRAHPGLLIRVVGYLHDPNDRRTKDQSLYAAEAGEDVPRSPIKRKLRRKAAQARYRDKNRARINADLRARRAAKKGEKARANPWSQLVPKAYRGAVTQIEQHQRARAHNTSRKETTNAHNDTHSDDPADAV